MQTLIFIGHLPCFDHHGDSIHELITHQVYIYEAIQRAKTAHFAYDQLAMYPIDRVPHQSKFFFLFFFVIFGDL